MFPDNLDILGRRQTDTDFAAQIAMRPWVSMSWASGVPGKILHKMLHPPIQ